MSIDLCSCRPIARAVATPLSSRLLASMLLSSMLPALIATHVLAHGPLDANHQHGALHQQTASGVVYEDLNNNRRRDPGEPGLPGIRVSNGEAIVLTDETGKYTVPVDDDEILFVIKPRDWVTPLNDDNLPQFHYIHKPAGSPVAFKFAGVEPTGPLPESVDFPLRRRIGARVVQGDAIWGSATTRHRRG